jgi:two-component system sensor histidine kinase BaeS
MQLTILDSDTRVVVDDARLRRALSALLDNALQHTPEGGTVKVSMGALIMGYAVIDVTDSGAGIAEEDMPHIFEPYFSGKNANGDGAGLGLFVARHIIEAHGGRLTAISKPGTGSTFSIVLPLASA